MNECDTRTKKMSLHLAIMGHSYDLTTFLLLFIMIFRIYSIQTKSTIPYDFF